MNPRIPNEPSDPNKPDLLPSNLHQLNCFFTTHLSMQTDDIDELDEALSEALTTRGLFDITILNTGYTLLGSTPEGEMLWQGNFTPVFEEGSRLEHLRNLWQQAIEYFEMGRDFPSFGVGSFTEQFKMLKAHPMRRQLEAQPAYKTLQKLAEMHTASGSDIPTSGAVNVISSLEELLASLILPKMVTPTQERYQQDFHTLMQTPELFSFAGPGRTFPENTMIALLTDEGLHEGFIMDGVPVCEKHNVAWSTDEHPLIRALFPDEVTGKIGIPQPKLSPDDIHCALRASEAVKQQPESQTLFTTDLPSATQLHRLQQYLIPRTGILRLTLQSPVVNNTALMHTLYLTMREDQTIASPTETTYQGWMITSQEPVATRNQQ